MCSLISRAGYFSIFVGNCGPSTESWSEDLPSFSGVCTLFIFPSLIDIIPDITGKLEGEAIVRKAFRLNLGVHPTPFWYRVEGQPESEEEITDWIKPIRGLGDSTHVHVRFP